MSEPTAFLGGPFTTVWYQADLSALPEGSEGYIAVELTDWSGQTTGAGLSVPFAIQTEPHEVPQRAVTGA
jgi:hypothetical protein